MAKPLKLLIAYSLGCLTTIAILWVAISNNLYMYRLIPFCLIADIIIIAAVLIGTLISEVPYSGAHEETEEEIGTRPHKTFAQLVAEARGIKEDADVEDRQI